MRSWLVLGGLIALCLAVGALGGALTSSAVATWYPTLAKPSWTPPNWLFGPVWTALFIAMAVAAWLVWRAGGSRAAALLFGLQLAFNLAWSVLFFYLRSPLLGLIDIVALWSAVAATLWVFSKYSRPAGLLFVPYLAWVSFAGALNAAIWALN